MNPIITKHRYLQPGAIIPVSREAVTELVALVAGLREHHAAEVAQLQIRIEALSAPLQATAAPEGWKLVPIEMTDEMMDAWVNNGNDETTNEEGIRVAYFHMIAAAPAQPTDKGESL